MGGWGQGIFIITYLVNIKTITIFMCVSDKMCNFIYLNYYIFHQLLPITGAHVLQAQLAVRFCVLATPQFITNIGEHVHSLWDIYVDYWVVVSLSSNSGLCL